MNISSHNKKRYHILDLLRGVAVLLMILAHSVYFLHNSTSKVLLGLEKFSNSVCFVSFLLVSGATFYVAYFHNEEEWSFRVKRIFRRLRVLVLAYFVLAFVVAGKEIVTTYGLARLGIVADILTFRFLPSYVEFIPPFFVYPLIVVAFPKFFRKIAKSIPKALIFALSIYFLGALVYRVSMIDFVVPWKAFLVGSEGYYRFPILSYFPIYILGLSWGYWIFKVKNTKHLREVAESLALVSILGVAVAMSVSLALSQPVENLFLRWPPTLPFLLLGSGFTFALAVVFYLTKQLKKIPIIKDILLIFGQNALGLFWAHIFLLQIFNMSGGANTGSLLIFFALFSTVVVLSVALTTFIPFNLKFQLNFHRGHYEEDLEDNPVFKIGEEVYEEIEEDIEKVEKFFFLGRGKKRASKRLVKKRHILAASVTLALASFVTFPSIMQEIQMQTETKQDVYWWNDEYAYKRIIEVENLENFSEIPKGEILEFSLDHQTISKQKKAKIDGSDIKLVFWNGKDYEPVNFWLKNSWNQNNTILAFETKENVDKGKSLKDYYLYYGSLLGKDTSKKSDLVKLWDSKYKISLGNEENYPQLLTLSRRWNLKGYGYEKDKTIKISLETNKEIPESKANFDVLNTNISGELTKVKDNSWEGLLSFSDLEPGEYQIQAKLKDQDNILLSQKAAFYVSYPLYVSWTQDWEGYDVPDLNLATLSQVAEQYEIPMTHFFNPRIYTTNTITLQRQEYLTQWVKERRDSHGEEVDLHLHMFYDFVKDAGVEPKNSPNWGDGGDGYGSLTINYNEEEMTKILKKALLWFKEKDLGFPIAYRAGGWFANTQTLKALERVGIKADSSGRTSYRFYGHEGPWNLLPETQPYKPSKNDQNSSVNPTLDIWEIPNNGADSYWFSETDIINRFDQNYQGGILHEKRQITYLSHPQWFNSKEKQRITPVFNKMENYKYEKDLGPLVYVILEDIYKAWSNQ